VFFSEHSVDGATASLVGDMPSNKGFLVWRLETLSGRPTHSDTIRYDRRV